MLQKRKSEGDYSRGNSSPLLNGGSLSFPVKGDIVFYIRKNSYFRLSFSQECTAGKKYRIVIIGSMALNMCKIKELDKRKKESACCVKASVMYRGDIQLSSNEKEFVKLLIQGSDINCF